MGDWGPALSRLPRTGEGNSHPYAIATPLPNPAPALQPHSSSAECTEELVRAHFSQWGHVTGTARCCRAAAHPARPPPPAAGPVAAAKDAQSVTNGPMLP
jgi:hypothetical protein